MDDTWMISLRSAGSTDELLRLAQSYVAGWDEARLGLLPFECRPVLRAPNDIAAYAVTLVIRQMSNDPVPDRKALEEMATFFASAHVRLAEIFAGPRLTASRHIIRQLHLEDE
jgi:hypothetical protein